MEERLQKLLSQWGIASRRHAERAILDGRVRVNGDLARLGQKADPRRDRVEFDGKLVRAGDRPDSVYLLLNKPKGVVCTCDDPRGRTTVLDVLSPQLRRGRGVHPVGRLDTDSTGALLLTNDGDLTYGLTHPRHQVAKIYRVWVEGRPTPDALQAWREGIVLDGRTTLPAGVREIRRRSNGQTQLEISLSEGRNRQIRKVAALLGYPVVELHRTAIGSIQLQPSGQPPLSMGDYRPLSAIEIRRLKTQLDLPSVDVPADLKEHSG